MNTKSERMKKKHEQWHIYATQVEQKLKHMNIFSGDLLIYIYIQHMYTTYTYI